MEKWFLAYIIVINLLSAFVCRYDKRQARRGGWRVREKNLLLLALAGGAPLMYLTMLRIRHKTLHKRFMIGLPLIILFHVLLVILIGKSNPL